MTKHNLYLPWCVVENWHGKLAIVDSRHDGETTTKGRVCNLPRGNIGPRGENDRGVYIANAICAAMNATVKD
jgi:hypothetical protein